MKLLKNILCASVLMATTVTVAQQDPNRAFFRHSMNLVNPAFAGSNSSDSDSFNDKVYEANSEIGIDFRSQWSGISGAPETQSVFFSTGMGKNVGLGVSVVNDRTFIEDQTAIAVDFSYRLKVDDDNDLYLGIKAGATSYNANLSGLMTFGFGSDPSLNDINGGFNPAIGAGALLKGKRYFLSISTPNLITSDRLEDNDGTARLGESRPHYYLAGGYDIPLGASTLLRPAAIARLVEASPLSVEINVMFSFNRRFELGPIYRLNEGIGGMMLFNAANWVDLGYAYENASNNPIAVQSQGTHEVFIKLKM